MGTKLLLGFGGTVIQAIVHQEPKPFRMSTRFGGTVIQVVVHQRRGRGRRRACFGGTVNQAVVVALVAVVVRITGFLAKYAKPSLLTNQSDSCFANLGEGLFCR